MSKKYISFIFIVLIILGFYFYHSSAQYKKSSIQDGFKISLISEKSTYKSGDSFTVDVYVTNLKPNLYEYQTTPPCKATSEEISYLYNVDDVIKDYYRVETIDSNHGFGPMNCEAAEYKYYFLPGQTLHEKIRFTPIEGQKRPAKNFRLTIDGTFMYKTPYSLTISPDKEGDK